MPTVRRTPSLDHDAAELITSGESTTTIARKTGLTARQVSSIADAHGIRHYLNPTARSTRLRAQFLNNRLDGLTVLAAAQAVGVRPGTGDNFEHGLSRTPTGIEAFTPAGPFTRQYNSLMTTLTAVKKADSAAHAASGSLFSRMDLSIIKVDPYKPVASRFLSPMERETISDMRRSGGGVRAIARELGRSPGTISKELARNTADGADYHPHYAQRRTAVRRLRPKTPKLAGPSALRDYVVDGLRNHWTPDQIAGRIRRDHPDTPEMRVSHETIYDAFYVKAKGGLKDFEGVTLPSGRSRRKPRNRGTRSNSAARGFVGEDNTISQRPVEVTNRDIPGHWEGDLIVGAHGRSAVITLVERHSRFTVLGHLPHGRDAESVGTALKATVNRMDDLIWSSITWDRGTEMAGHRTFTTATEVAVFFADAGAPWQRGTNENTNGRIRRFLPKSTDLSVHSPEDLEAIENILNHTPRKCLDYRTPAEVFYDWLEQDGSVEQSA